jgi:hypothetical protein
MTRMFAGARVRTLAAAGGAVLLVAPFGCGGSEKAAPDNATPVTRKAPAAVVSDDLVGRWTRTVPASATVKLPSGKWTMLLRADGSLEMYLPGSHPAMDDDCLLQAACEPYRVQASDGKLIVGDTLGCTLSSARYSYTLAGDKLTTRRVRDDCFRGDRAQWFHRATWRRQP